MNENSVLNVSTKGNVLDGNNKPQMRVIKLNSSLAVRPIRTPMKIEKDSENIPPPAASAVSSSSSTSKNVAPLQPKASLMIAQPKVMTFDQQSQTDSNMFGKSWDSMPGATAAQMHQQSQLLAQLIAANNGLVVAFRESKEMVAELDKKLTVALEMLGSGAGGGGGDMKLEAEDPHYPLPDNYMEDIIVYDALNGDESVSRSSFTGSGGGTSKNTPPLKKNKQKLRQVTIGGDDGEDDQSDEMVVIGDGGTQVPNEVLQGMVFAKESFSTCTRKILMAVFDRETLATHSLTGKPSPAFLERGSKNMLDPAKVQDIIEYVSNRCGVSKTHIRSVITSKCADENKMQRLKKRSSLGSTDSGSNKRRSMHF